MPAKVTKQTTKKRTNAVQTRAPTQDASLPWTKEHIERYNMLYKKFLKTHPQANYETFIDDNANPRYMMKFIEDSTYCRGVKKYLLYMVNRYLYRKGNRYAKKYADMGKIYRERVEDEEYKNQFEENELLNYRDRQFFTHIIEEKKENYETHDFKNHIKFLALCLVVLQPPVRSSYYVTAEIIHKQADNNKIDNFIFVNRRSKDIEYIVYKDKLSKSYTYSKEDRKHIQVDDLFLKHLIHYSIKKFPRKYLLQTDFKVNNKLGTSNTMLNWLRRLTQLDGLTINMMRSSYINWFYRVNLDQASREALARKMLHSVDAAQKYYFKTEANPTIDSNPEIVDLTGENEVIKNQLAVCQRQKKENKKIKKERYDLIYRYNKNGAKPRKSTLEKHNIVFNVETGLFE